MLYFDVKDNPNLKPPFNLRWVSLMPCIAMPGRMLQWAESSWKGRICGYWGFSPQAEILPNHPIFFNVQIRVLLPIQNRYMIYYDIWFLSYVTNINQYLCQLSNQVEKEIIAGSDFFLMPSRQEKTNEKSVEIWTIWTMVLFIFEESWSFWTEEHTNLGAFWSLPIAWGMNPVEFHRCVRSQVHKDLHKTELRNQ